MEYQTLSTNCQYNHAQQYHNNIPPSFQEKCAEFSQTSIDPAESLKNFLQTATHNWNPNEMIRKYAMQNGEEISCVCWGQRFYITGTDIVKVVQFRFLLARIPVVNIRKFEEEPRSPFLEFLYSNGCIRTQKKQKVFFWTSVPHDRLFKDALERDVRRGSTKKTEMSFAVRSGASCSKESQTVGSYHSTPVYQQSNLVNTNFEGNNVLHPIVSTLPVVHPHSFPYMESSWVSAQYGSTNPPSQYSYQLSSLTIPEITSFESRIPLPYSQSEVKLSPIMPHQSQLGQCQGTITDDCFDNIAQATITECNHSSNKESIYWAPLMHSDHDNIISSVLVIQDEKQQQKEEYSYDASLPLSLFDLFMQDSNLDFPTLDSVTKSCESSCTIESINTQVCSDIAMQSLSPNVDATIFMCQEPRKCHLDFQQYSIDNHQHEIKSPSRELLMSQADTYIQHTRSGSPNPCNHFLYDKGFICNFEGCGRSFKRIEHLKRHNRTHTGEKPYICPVDGCGKSFSRSDNLSQHSKKHVQTYYMNVMQPPIQQYCITVDNELKSPFVQTILMDYHDQAALNFCME